MRTTGLQVSGYSFILRRTELALVTGDPRMAHDPLRTQRRATGVGVLLALLVAGGVALTALLRPAPSVGDALLVTDETGTLHVRLGERFHPVTNVASARLLLGSAENVDKATASELADLPAGPPVGIPDVPGLSPVPGGSATDWFYCADTVVATDASVDAGPQILVAPSGWWLAVDGRRMLIPDKGDTVARAFGAVPVETADTVAAVLDRGPDVVLPAGPAGADPAAQDTPFAPGTLVTAGDRAFVATAGGMAEVNGARRAVAEALSPSPPVASDLGTVLRLPGARALEHVPAGLVFRQVGEVCAGVRLVERPSLGESRAEHSAGTGSGTGLYDGPRGTVALATERGFALVSASGIRYSVPSQEELDALGVLGDGELPVVVPWRVIDALPDGGELSAARARGTD
ncbi:ESX-1 secretion system ATPase EccB1 [Corynebacterium provencense]|uniref:ESX-1 secretion system ATPase EccB1 n=1 Tax=Corynebacterium provencense TaxID=1737425 RepID=A0A2Z3YMM9_9CORY|nr:type VII secretion protein EccB [Corynebacterium provencense]AWT25472.1 ESX-1 secretion system ATPase EccB1 [Corynebacterium provencense]